LDTDSEQIHYPARSSKAVWLSSKDTQSLGVSGKDWLYSLCGWSCALFSGFTGARGIVVRTQGKSFCTLEYQWRVKKKICKVNRTPSAKPTHSAALSVITGSGMNLKRKKFIEIMEAVARKEIKLIVVAHKDRLARFGFEFIEWFCNSNNCQIEIINNSYKTPHQELVDDFMAMGHRFSSKLYFLRRYKDEIKKEVEQLDKQA
jgi:hypothetical protein